MTPPSTLISPTPAPNNQTADQTQPPLSNTPPQPNHGNPQHHGGSTGNLPLSKKINKKLQIALLAIFVVLIAGAGIYFVFFSRAGVSMTGSEGEFTPITPTRVLDTRAASKIGTATSLAANVEQRIKILGVGALPANNVSAIIVTATVFRPTTDGYLDLQDGNAIPNPPSTLAYKANVITTQQFTVPVSAEGYIYLKASGQGPTDIVLDVSGYYATVGGNPGARYELMTPARVVDTLGTTPLGTTRFTKPDQTKAIPIAGVNGVPKTAKAVTMLITKKGLPSGFVTIWGAGPRPNAYTLFTGSEPTTTTQVTVPLGPDGSVLMYSQLSGYNFTIDVIGYFGDVEPEYNTYIGGRYLPLFIPATLLDTRGTSTTTKTDGTATTAATPLKAGETRNIKVTDQRAITDATRAAIIHVRVVKPTTQTNLTLWASGELRPNTASISFVAGETLTRQVTVPVGNDGSISIYNSAGDTNVVLEMVGSYAEYTETTFNGFNAATTINTPTYITDPKELTYDITYNNRPTKDPRSSIYQNIKLARKTPQASSWSTEYTPYSPSIDLYNNKISIQLCTQPTCIAYNPTSTTKVQGYTSGTSTIDPYNLYTFTYPFEAGKTYRVLTQLLIDKSGFAGDWLKYSIMTPSDSMKGYVATELAMVKLAETAIANYYDASSNLVQGTAGRVTGFNNDVTYSISSNPICGTPELNSATITNITLDGQVGQIGSNPEWLYASGEASCPGIGKVDYSRDSTGKINGFNFSSGIAKAQRDTTPPVIGDLKKSVISTSYYQTATATDSNMVTSMNLSVKDAWITSASLYQIPLSYLTSINSLTRTWNVTSVTSNNPFVITAKDNSGNEAVKTFDWNFSNITPY